MLNATFNTVGYLVAVSFYLWKKSYCHRPSVGKLTYFANNEWSRSHIEESHSQLMFTPTTEAQVEN